MKSITEEQALQNAADRLGLKIHQSYQCDKRKSISRYFAAKNGCSISPVLDYEQLNHFLLGYSRAMQIINNQ